MTVVAVDFAFHQGGASTLPRPSHRLAGGFIDGKKIVPVHGYARHVKAAGAIGEIMTGARIFAGSGFGITIVFDYEDTWQVPDCGEVEAFERRSLVRTSVAHKAHSNAFRAKFLSRQRGSAGQGRTAAHNPVGT